jgi:hypothetical protein
LLALRRSSAALQIGTLELVDSPDGVLGFQRTAPASDKGVTVLINFTGDEVAVDRTGDVLISSIDARDGRVFDGALRPDEAVVLAPG